MLRVGNARAQRQPAPGEASAALQFDDGAAVSARLVVGADGLRSWVRAAAGIDAHLHPYGQTAVVANFA